MQGKGISITAYGSLGHAGNDLAKIKNSVLDRLRLKYNKTTAQILLRWALDRGIAVIPGATSEAHIRENLNVIDFALDSSEMVSLEGRKPGKWQWYHAVPGT